MFFIYKITNKVNGKIYIGKTCRNIAIRWREHCSKSNQQDKYYLHNAIHKYGKDNFIIEVIDSTEDENIINDLEKKWIKYYNSQDRKYGYNLTEGGDGNLHYSWEEIRELWDKGYSVKEISKIMGCYRGTVGEALKEYENYDYKTSLQRSSAMKKEIIKYDLNGNYICSYPSITIAAKENSCSTAILSKCLKNKEYSAINFLWTYKDEELPKNIRIKQKRNTKGVSQYDLNGCFIKSYDTAASAAREVRPEGNVNSVSGTIIQVCKGKRNTAYGYKWKYNKELD